VCDAVLIRRLGVFGRWLFGALLAASVSFAAPPTGSGEAPSAAEARFEGGVVAYDEGRFRDAIELFKEADRLSPSARLSFNIAKVYERMGDNRNALAAYRDYLRRLPAAENQGEVSQRVRELEQSLTKLGVQQLSVLSVPDGATVLIDDVSRGVTPWTGELPPGPHRVALRLQEYQEAALNIELPAAHAIDVAVVLTALAAARSSAVAAAPTSVAFAEPSPTEAPTSEHPLRMPDTDAALPSFRTWALFGGALAACAGSLGFELSRRDMEDSARSPIQIVHQEKFEAMERRQTAARVFLGAGLLGAVAAGISLYFDIEASSANGTELAMDCDVSGCRVLGGGRF
jgi:tetratricopeptide (TPR) repeat protein